MKKKLINAGIKILSLVVFTSGVLGLISATESESYGKVEKVIVDISPLDGEVWLIEKEDLAKMLNKQYKLKLKGQSIQNLDLIKIEKIIEKSEYVQDAQVYIDARNNLKISVVQKMPIMRVFLPNQHTFFITNQGSKIPVPGKSALRLPVLTGNLKEFKKSDLKDSTNVYFKAYHIMKAIRENPFMLGLTEQLVADSLQDIVLIPKLGNHRIILGNADDIENKFKRLEIFYKKGMPSEGWNLYKEINLKYRDQVIATKANLVPIKS
ncbi:MAG: hypothetical protein J5I59_02335 [Saprospiraceae bacterium]|nr:hypothetical protein [Saprospiraceae bacterium]